MIKRKDNKRDIFLIFFFLFVFFAIIITITLEYIDVKKKDSPSVILNKKTAGEKEEKLDPLVITKKFDIFLKANKISFDYFLGPDQLYHFKISLLQNEWAETKAKIEDFFHQVGVQFSQAEKQDFADKSLFLFLVRIKEKTTHIVLIDIIKKKKTFPPSGQKPDSVAMIAFIIDDIGYRDQVSQELKSLNIPITASVLPNTPFCRQEAKKLYEFGLEMIIHLPMQAINSNNHYSLSQYVSLDSSEEDINNLLKNAIGSVPFARGVNNHEGSLVTADSDLMIKVLKIIKREGLFFIDSRTSNNSIAYSMARKLNIRTAFRDIFLDHVKTYDHTMEQIQKLMELAEEKGEAIAIGHPFESTFKAIKDSIPLIQKKGIRIVFVSQLLD